MRIRPVVKQLAALGLAFAIPLMPLKAQTPEQSVTEIEAPLPVLLDRERLAARTAVLPPHVIVTSASLPLSLSIGGEVGAPLYWTNAIKLASVTLRNTGDVAVRDVLVLLRASEGRIEDALVDGLRWRETEHGWIATIPELAAGSEISIVVRFALGAPATPTGTARSELRAIVKPREAETIEAALDWSTGDCAARYASRLSSLRGNPARDARQALRDALTRAADLPKRPLFPVAVRELDEDLRAALRLAERMRSSGGVDTSLRSNEFKWLTGRLTRDLNNYVNQPATPAICAPATPMLDFLSRRAAPLQGKIDAASKSIALWQDHARGLAREALRVLATQRFAASDPALVAAVTVPDLAPEWGDIVTQLASAAGMNPGQIETLSDTDTALARLMVAKDALDNDPAFAATTVMKPRRAGSSRLIKVRAENPQAALLRQVFGAIERAIYLDLAAARYDALASGFTDSLAELRKANQESCTCSY